MWGSVLPLVTYSNLDPKCIFSHFICSVLLFSLLRVGSIKHVLRLETIPLLFLSFLLAYLFLFQKTLFFLFCLSTLCTLHYAVRLLCAPYSQCSTRLDWRTDRAGNSAVAERPCPKRECCHQENGHACSSRYRSFSNEDFSFKTCLGLHFIKTRI